MIINEYKSKGHYKMPAQQQALPLVAMLNDKPQFTNDI